MISNIHLQRRKILEMTLLKLELVKLTIIFFILIFYIIIYIIIYLIIKISTYNNAKLNNYFFIFQIYFYQ